MVVDDDDDGEDYYSKIFLPVALRADKWIFAKYGKDYTQGQA